MDVGGIFRSLVEVFRYAYGGMLLYFILYLLIKEEIVQFVNDVGMTAALIIFTMASGLIYGLYRALYCDTIVDGIFTCFHSYLSKERNYKYKGYSNKIHLLKEKYGLPMNLKYCFALDAYRVIRDHLFTDKEKRSFELQHAESHVLYMTSFISLIFFFATMFFNIPNRDSPYDPIYFLLAFIISLGTGWKLEGAINRRECAAILSKKECDIKRYLSDTKFANYDKSDLQIHNERAIQCYVVWLITSIGFIILTEIVYFVIFFSIPKLGIIYPNVLSVLIANIALLLVIMAFFLLLLTNVTTSKGLQGIAILYIVGIVIFLLSVVLTLREYKLIGLLN